MPENRNSGGLSFDNRGTACVSVDRVFDCCRDRDCFEDQRVYLTPFGEETLTNATQLRIRNANILWAYVGVDDVPFNTGFYQVHIRFYVDVECEACLGLGKSQSFHGLSVLEKTVVLYGGEGKVASYTSGPENQFCGIGGLSTSGTNEPTAVVECVDPVVLGYSVVPDCPCGPGNDTFEIPEGVRKGFDSDLVLSPQGLHLYVSLGLFSVVRIQRPTLLLVQGTDYSVPEKECSPSDPDDPCTMFRAMAFPVGQFQGTGNNIRDSKPSRPGCSLCPGKNNS